MLSTKKYLTLSAIAAATLMSGSALANIEASISVIDADQLTASKDVVVNVSFTNTGAEKLQMLKYLMKPNKNGDLEEHLFNVKRDGVALRYNGMHVKRPSPTQADYMAIQPGQTVSYQAELSGVYDLSVAGEYSFQYNTKNMSLFSAKPMTNQKAAIKGMDGVVSNVTSSYIAQGESYVGDFVKKASKKRCNPRKEDCGGGEPHPSGIEFTGSCSAGEVTDLVSAWGAAQGIANDSVSSLNGQSGDRFAEWFGNGSHNTVAGNFDSIKDALDNQQLTFDCSCNQSYFAYVYPDQPYKVYFCGAFWNANELGTDSRAGTIIHEISHFTAVAGTDDIVYGQSGARSLAISNP
ncbi:MAG: peptidyl-Lys metalloendopeptidase, partial [Phenylobacterium sp.]